MLILMFKKKFKAIINTLKNKNDAYVELEFKKFVDEMNDEGQDYMKGYGDGYARACKYILNKIVK